MKTKTIRQSVSIPAAPRTVYAALMDSVQHSAFTGDKAVISPKVGASLKAYFKHQAKA